MDQKPLASQALIDYLDQCFPDRATDSRDLATIMYETGRIAVVRKLKSDLKAASNREE